MTRAEAGSLKNGLYVLHWRQGGTSLAAVGRDHFGVAWFAPCNWVGFSLNANPPWDPSKPEKVSFVPCQDWRAVKAAVAIPVPKALHR